MSSHPLRLPAFLTLSRLYEETRWLSKGLRDLDMQDQDLIERNQPQFQMRHLVL